MTNPPNLRSRPDGEERTFDVKRSELEFQRGEAGTDSDHLQRSHHILRRAADVQSRWSVVGPRQVAAHGLRRGSLSSHAVCDHGDGEMRR